MKITLLQVAIVWLVFSTTRATCKKYPVYHGAAPHLYPENFPRGPSSPMVHTSKQVSMIKEYCEPLFEGKLLENQLVLEVCINLQHPLKEKRQKKGRLGKPLRFEDKAVNSNDMKYELHQISKTKHIEEIPPNLYTCLSFKYWMWPLPTNKANQYTQNEKMLLTLVFLMIAI